MKKLLGIALVIMLTACLLIGCAANTNGTTSDNDSGLLATQAPNAQTTQNAGGLTANETVPAGTNAPAATGNTAGDVGGSSVG